MTIAYLFRSCTLILVLLLPVHIVAYDNDAHFWLTYYLSIKAGFTPIQATQIASANISIDLAPETAPGTTSARHWKNRKHFRKYMQMIHRKYHAFPSVFEINKHLPKRKIKGFNPLFGLDIEVQRISNQLVREDKEKFWKRTVRLKGNPGPFLHYLQDSVSHRGFRHVIGHMGYDRVDFLASKPERAHEMARLTFQYLNAYRKLINESDSTIGDEIEAVESVEINSKKLEEIKLVVDQLIKINPSAGYRENSIVKRWNRGSRSRIPTIWTLKRLQKEGLSPDSSKARNVIRKSLRLGNSSIPSIWFYDYSLSRWAGIVRVGFATRAYKYVSSKQIKSLSRKAKGKHHTFQSERSILGKKRREFVGKKRLSVKCLPFKLVKKDVTDFSTCKR